MYAVFPGVQKVNIDFVLYKERKREYRKEKWRRWRRYARTQIHVRGCVAVVLLVCCYKTSRGILPPFSESHVYFYLNKSVSFVIVVFCFRHSVCSVLYVGNYYYCNCARPLITQTSGLALEPEGGYTGNAAGSGNKPWCRRELPMHMTVS